MRLAAGRKSAVGGWRRWRRWLHTDDPLTSAMQLVQRGSRAGHKALRLPAISDWRSHLETAFVALNVPFGHSPSALWPAPPAAAVRRRLLHRPAATAACTLQFPAPPQCTPASASAVHYTQLIMLSSQYAHRHCTLRWQVKSAVLQQALPLRLLRLPPAAPATAAPASPPPRGTARGPRRSR